MEIGASIIYRTCIIIIVIIITWGSIYHQWHKTSCGKLRIFRPISWGLAFFAFHAEVTNGRDDSWLRPDPECPKWDAEFQEIAKCGCNQTKYKLASYVPETLGQKCSLSILQVHINAFIAYKIIAFATLGGRTKYPNPKNPSPKYPLVYFCTYVTYAKVALFQLEWLLIGWNFHLRRYAHLMLPLRLNRRAVLKWSIHIHWCICIYGAFLHSFDRWKALLLEVVKTTKPGSWTPYIVKHRNQVC